MNGWMDGMGVVQYMSNERKFVKHWSVMRMVVVAVGVAL